MGMRKAGRLAEYAILFVISVAFILPVAILVVESFSGAAGTFSFENYRLFFQKPRNATAFYTGLSLSAGASLVAAAVSLSASIAFCRNKGPFADFMTVATLILGGLPYCTLVIPLYFLLFQARFLDSLPVIVLFLAAANIPANIWLFKRFLDTIPAEIEETSVMDGASTFFYYSRIVFPQLLPVMTGIVLTTFINCWGNFIVPFILISSSKKLPAALAFFQAFSAGDPGQYPYFSAYAIIYYVPVIILYCILRLGMTKIFVVRRLRA
jgi:multiple sugar transport system permease protein